LRQRLARAQAALTALGERRCGKTPLRERSAVEAALAAILQSHRVADLLRVEVVEQWHERQARAYKGQPSRVEQHWDYRLVVEVDQVALEELLPRLGWRVYATNQPAEQLSVEQAVLYYREEYLIEQSIGRLKGAPLSLRPFYLQRDDHAKGLVRLLLLGVRMLCLLEWVVRRKLAAAGASLRGLYAGQPQASTNRPSAERLLGSVNSLKLPCIEQAGQVYYHLTPLSALQQRILTLLGFSPKIYTDLAVVLAQSP
jgi:transposase